VLIAMQAPTVTDAATNSRRYSRFSRGMFS
jgi:hypothetical protein